MALRCPDALTKVSNPLLIGVIMNVDYRNFRRRQKVMLKGNAAITRITMLMTINI